MPDEVVCYVPALVGPLSPIQFHSCFISYSTQDQAFADRLDERLRGRGLRVWFAPHDMRGGRKVRDQLEAAIDVHDQLLLVLSEHSMGSRWVAAEAAHARQREARERRQVLFPIRLCDLHAIEQWQCVNADGGAGDAAAEVREYFIPDFSNWKDDDAFEAAFARLLRDLQASAGSSPPEKE